MKETDDNFSECTVICEECNKSTIVNDTDYSYVNDEIEEDGWIVKYIEDDWYDFCCKECYDKFVSRLK